MEGGKEIEKVDRKEERRHDRGNEGRRDRRRARRKELGSYFNVFNSCISQNSRFTSSKMTCIL